VSAFINWLIFLTSDESFKRLEVEVEYFRQDIRQKMTGVEVVADATEWLAMKYKDRKKDHFVFHFHDDDELPETEAKDAQSNLCI